MKHLTPLRAIRQYCLVCAGRPKDVRECLSAESCVLHIYRQGHNPARKGAGPKRVCARSIPKGVLPNSTRVFERFPEGIRAMMGMAMSKGISLNQGAKNTKKRSFKMEGQGKIQICRDGKEILIRVTDEN